MCSAEAAWPATEKFLPARGETRCFSLSSSPWLKDRDRQRRLLPGGEFDIPHLVSSVHRRQEGGSRIIQPTGERSTTLSRRAPRGIRGRVSAGCPFGRNPTGGTTQSDGF